jgi:acetylornithine deacetylase/succinyl-diaminopimelate desuccinylase-like protein
LIHGKNWRKIFKITSKTCLSLLFLYSFLAFLCERMKLVSSFPPSPHIFGVLFNVVLLFLLSFSSLQSSIATQIQFVNYASDTNLEKSLEKNVRELCHLIGAESVSAFSTSDGRKGVEEARRIVEEKLKELKFDSIKTFDLSKFHPKAHSVMVGEKVINKPSMLNVDFVDETLIPTVLFYNHYDTQPADGLWTESEAFPKSFEECASVDSDTGNVTKVKGRGASDNKGNLWAVLSAIEAYMAKKGNKPVRVVVLMEGQEEIGSPGLDVWMKKYAKQYLGNVDAAFSADGSTGDWNKNGVLTLGLRGGVDLEITVQNGAEVDLHSGSFGGAILNPIHALSALMASFHDPKTGKILVEGYYEDIYDFSKEEIDRMKRDFPSNKEFRKTASGGALFGETNVSVAEQVGVRPTIEFVGVYGGYVGDGIKTVLPNYASAKIVSRLAPGQNPQKSLRLLKKHVKKTALRISPGAYVSTVDSGFSNEPFLGQIDSVSNRVAKKVLTEVYDGIEPKVVYEGGSIPVMRMIQKYASIEPGLMAFSTKDNMYHAPNEYYSIDQFKTATRSYVRVLAEVSEFEKKGRSELELEVRRKARYVKEALRGGLNEAKKGLDPALDVAKESLKRGYDTFVDGIRHVTGKQKKEL